MAIGQRRVSQPPPHFGGGFSSFCFTCLKLLGGPRKAHPTPVGVSRWIAPMPRYPAGPSQSTPHSGGGFSGLTRSGAITLAISQAHPTSVGVPRAGQPGGAARQLANTSPLRWGFLAKETLAAVDSSLANTSPLRWEYFLELHHIPPPWGSLVLAASPTLVGVDPACKTQPHLRGRLSLVKPSPPLWALFTC